VASRPSPGTDGVGEATKEGVNLHRVVDSPSFNKLRAAFALARDCRLDCYVGSVIAVWAWPKHRRVRRPGSDLLLQLCRILVTLDPAPLFSVSPLCHGFPSLQLEEPAPL
jgi:hypothetical protein